MWLSLVLLAGCTGKSRSDEPGSDASDSATPDSDTPEPTGDPDGLLAFSVAKHSGGPLAFAFQIERSAPIVARVRCEATAGAADVLVGATAEETTSVLVIRGFRPDTPYACAATLEGGDPSAPRAVTSAPLPADLPLPELVVGPSDPSAVGYTMLPLCYVAEKGVIDTQYLVIVDPRGDVRWYSDDLGCGSLDMSHLGGGLFLVGGKEMSPAAPRILDLDGQVTWTAPSDVSTPDEVAGSFSHDVGLSADGQAVYLLVGELRGLMKGFAIKRIDLATGAITWTWSSFTDGIDAGQLAPSPGDIDPFHANSLSDAIEGGSPQVYVGLRDHNGLLKIDVETKTVTWKLGPKADFSLLDEAGEPASDPLWFYHQHDAKRVGSDVIVYDNGEERFGGETYSRALVLRIDEDARTARIVLDYREEDWYEAALGGLDRLPNGNYLIARPLTATYLQIDADGEVLWRVAYPARYTGYRAEPIPSCDLFGNVTLCPDLE